MEWTTLERPLKRRVCVFVWLVREERDAEGQHVTWRFSLQDSQKEARIGFKNLDELTAFLEEWMKNSAEDDPKKFSQKEK